MRRIQLAGLAALLGLSVTATLPLSSCSSGGDSATSGPMYIETCTLGCSNGQSGQQVSCTIVDVAQNVEITVLFSQAVNLSSVNAGSFRITNTGNGSSPVGTFAVDPQNNKRLIFRPALTFDAVGNPIYALDPNQTYEILIPGTAQGDTGSLVRSQAGKINETRLRCTINTTQGLLDPVPGPPTAFSSVEVIEKDTGEVLEVFSPADGSVGVPVGGGSDGMNTIIVTEFDDIMNPATLANLATGQSSNVLVEIDVDGDAVTTDDRVTQAGAFQVVVDFESLKTTLTFTPFGGFPSGGTPESPRLIVLTMPLSARDLVGNPLSNPGESAFQTVEIVFPELILPVADPNIPDDMPGEQFQNQDNEDVARSGSDWGNGRLTYGVGGGTGRLGSLTVGTGSVVELNTDEQEFPYSYNPESPGPDDPPDLTSFVQVNDLLDNAVPSTEYPLEGDYNPTDRTTWPTITVEDGAFEFTALNILPGGLLRLVGSNPGRFFSRGQLTLDGVLDISGGSAIDLISNTGNAANGGLNTAEGGPGGEAGPSAGPGGSGGDRYNQGLNDTVGCDTTPMTNAGGIIIPDMPPNNPGSANDGDPGGGVGGTLLAAGSGGIHWPPAPPRQLSVDVDEDCTGNSEYVIAMQPDGTFRCRIAMVGGAGAGGGYALDGGQGISVSPEEGLVTQPGNLPLAPEPSAGGMSNELGIEAPGTTPATVRRLDYAEGNLRGGSGGGGGGMSVYGTQTNSQTVMPGGDCLGPSGSIFPYWDHRAAGGGGGGGAVQLVSGTRLSVGFNGVIDAGGGSGGGSTVSSFPISNCLPTPAPSTTCTDLAQPGGGGSGGAVRMQSLVVDIAEISDKVIVAGGMGGLGSTGSAGGEGSPGLVRIEHTGTIDVDAEAAVYAQAISPYMPNDPMFNDPFDSAAILSIGRWDFQRNRPDSLNASMSCWMIPEGNFFELAFQADESMEMNPTDDPAGKGWNMDILYAGDTGIETYPYRGLPQTGTSPLGNVDFQTFLQNLINSDEAPGEGSLIAVRFQGARSAGDVEDPCNVTLAGFGADIQSNSLTRWVMHPDELNMFTPRPNMVRFCVVFEENLKSQGPMQFRIQGVTNLQIKVQPN